MVIKKIKGNKRHIITNNQGGVLATIVAPANQHDSKQLMNLVQKVHMQQPFYLREVLADGAYIGFADKLMNDYAIVLDVKINLKDKGFEVTDSRWKVERTFSWMKGYRRLDKDHEQKASTSEAFILIFSIMNTAKRIKKHQEKNLSG